MITAQLDETPGTTTISRSSSTDFVARAKTLRALIESEAAKAENSNTLSLKVVEAMREQELFWLLVPKSLGGTEGSVITFIKMLEEIARSDGSSGWSLMANSAATVVASHFCSDAHVARMFGGKRMPIMAATYMPTGKAVLNRDTYRGGGRYSFGSGIAHADWVAGALVVHENGSPQKQADGKPRVVGAFLSKEQIRLHGNWDVVGLQSTGSFDYEIPEQDIPVDWTFNQYWTEPRRGSNVAGMGALATVYSGHTGVILGMANRALEEVARIATQRKRLGSTETIASTQIFRIEFAKHEALYRAARALVLQVFADAEATANTGKAISNMQLQRIRQTCTWAHQAARDVVRFSYDAVSASLRKPSVLGKYLVDVSVGAQHIVVDPMTLVDAAPLLIESWADAGASA